MNDNYVCWLPLDRIYTFSLTDGSTIVNNQSISTGTNIAHWSGNNFIYRQRQGSSSYSYNYEYFDATSVLHILLM